MRMTYDESLRMRCAAFGAPASSCSLLQDGRSEDRTANAYRLLRTSMNTAANDGRIKRNPCRVKGAGQYRTQCPCV